MKRYEQIVSIYGTIVVNAESEEEAKDEIDNFIQALRDGYVFLAETELIVGDVERENDIKEMD